MRAVNPPSAALSEERHSPQPGDSEVTASSSGAAPKPGSPDDSEEERNEGEKLLSTLRNYDVTGSTKGRKR